MNEFPERVLADNAEEQFALDRLQRVAWIESLCPWQVMCTFTWRDRSFQVWRDSAKRHAPVPGLFNVCGMSVEGARRRFEQWMRKYYRQISFYYALEKNPGRPGYHVHSLWGDCRSVFRREAWAKWLHQYGHARIEPVKNKEHATDYASKYLCKENGWWGLSLQWHRLQNLQPAKPYAFVSGPGGV